VRQIEDQILRGRLRPGERLPPECELCDQFEVSRTVVREALLILRQMGLLESRRGVGTFVSEAIPERVSDAVVRLLEVHQVSVWDVHELREILEPALAALAAQRAGEEDLREIVAAMEGLQEEGADQDRFIEADLDFHAAIADATQNSVFRVMLLPILDVSLESRRLGVAIPGAVQLATVHHQRIVGAIRAGDAPRARATMIEHLRSVADHMRQAEQLRANTV
jgi:GntR family transcriptional repressor for pyruvate dehydrogenase complex